MEKVKKKNEDSRAQNSQVETSTQQPSIDETSRRIIEEKMGDRKNQPTHERLYNLQKERQAKQAQAVLNSNQTMQQSRIGGDGNVSVSKREKPLD